MMPDLANEGTSILFNGWFTDEACTAKLTDFEVKADTVLYGQWGEAAEKHTITFDTRGGTPVAPVTAKVGAVVELPKGITKGDWRAGGGGRATLV